MLRMSKLADYGTVLLVAMARSPDAVRSVGTLASVTRIPAPTVAKLMKTFVRGGLAVSLRGANGGYLLRRAPEQVTLADVIVAVDGPFGMTECSAVPGLCTQEPTCAARANWQKVNRLVLDALRQVSLADMAAPALTEIDIDAIRARAAPPAPPARAAGIAPATAARKAAATQRQR